MATRNSCWGLSVTANAREVEIGRLGAQGDGIAETPAGEMHVPYALPGELWRITQPDELLRPHPDRVEPVCRHFGSCGGCVAQHMPPQLYSVWKRNTLVQALRHRGIEAEVEALRPVPLHSRRRVMLHARRAGKSVQLGYHRRAAHDIIPISECPIAVPQIVAALPVLTEMLEPMLAGKAEASVTLTATSGGLDVSIVLSHGRAPKDRMPRLAALATHRGIARLTVGGEAVALAQRPLVRLGGVAVEPPPGAFLQAVETAQEDMVRLVLEHVGAAKRLADLFCGLGTFTLAMARNAQVLAVDGDRKSLDALQAAARHARGLKPIETKVRDLFREPLSARELQGFDAVVFDPPRAGARAQAEELARSKVHTVVAVSCNPGTLARDVRSLLDGGYRLGRVTPIDQFLFSHHVEAVAVLRR